MSKHEFQQNKIVLIVPTLCVLFLGVVVSVVQLQRPQLDTTNAATAPTITIAIGSTGTNTSGITPTLLPTLKPAITPTPTLNPFPPSEEPTGIFYPSITPIPTLPIPSPTFPTGPTPTPDPNFGKTPFDMQAELKVKFPSIGLGGNRNPKHLSRRVDVYLMNTNNVQVASSSSFLKYDGSNYFVGLVHFGAKPDGYYYVKVQGQQTLIAAIQPVFQAMYSNRLNLLPAVTLIQGDITGDNALTLDDFTLALTCFQDKQCQTIDTYDLNDDGRTDLLDYNELLHSYWQFLGD